VFADGEVGGVLEGEALDDVVVLENTFDAAPEEEVLEFVFLAQFENADFQGDAFLGGEGLPDAVNKLQFRSQGADLHLTYYYQLQIGSAHTQHCITLPSIPTSPTFDY
jgi:hypothetical protein